MQLSTRSAEIESLSQAGRQVLAALLQHKSMPFLELESLLPRNREELRCAVDDLAKMRLVRVINPDDIIEKIVTATGRAFALQTSRLL